MDGKDQIIKFDKNFNILFVKTYNKINNSYIIIDNKNNCIIINNDDNCAAIFKSNYLLSEPYTPNDKCILTDSNLPLVNNDMPLFSIANN